MLDTARSFAIRWLLEPAMKKKKNNIRIIMAAMETAAFPILKAISEGITNYSIFDETYKLGASYNWQKQQHIYTLAYKIYDGEQYIGAFTTVSESHTSYTVNDIEIPEKQETIYVCPNLDLVLETYGHSYKDDYTMHEKSVTKYTNIVPINTKLITIPNNNIIEVEATYHKTIDYENSYGTSSHDEYNGTHNIKTNFYPDTSDHFWGYTGNLNSENILKYVSLFKENDNYIEYDFSIIDEN